MTMYKRILVPFDNSESARNALKTALDLADGVEGAHVCVLSVIEWHDYNAETFKIASRMSGVVGDGLDMNAISEIDAEAEQTASMQIEREISDIVNQSDSSVDVEIAVVNGSPHDTIVAYASDLDYDCICMGHRGIGAIRAMLGSVAFSVLQKANRPVLVVK
jgi:nucleotide-binding universal stress UspA family protein